MLTPSPIGSPSLSFNHVANMDAEAKLDPPVFWDACVPLNHSILYFDSAAYGVNRTTELDYRAVTRTLNDASVMNGYCRVDDIAAEPSEACECPVLVGAGEPAVANDIRN